MFNIRPFKSADLDPLYVISLATGHEGSDASRLYKDGRLIGHVYAAPYALLEPSLALVVEDKHGVAGFVLGTPDTDNWSLRLEDEWWPNLRVAYKDPGNIPAPDWSADQRRAFMIHHPAPPPRWIIERYPAHRTSIYYRVFRGKASVAYSSLNGSPAPPDTAWDRFISALTEPIHAPLVLVTAGLQPLAEP